MTGREGRALLAVYGNTVAADPPSRQAADSFRKWGWSVHAVEGGLKTGHQPVPVAGCVVHDATLARAPRSPIHTAGAYAKFARALRSCLGSVDPDVLISVMLHPLALAARGFERMVPCTVVAILDVPPPGYSGRVGDHVVRRGWRRLRAADVVWASDEYKARLARELGALSEDPIVCRNCPASDYFPDVPRQRDPWLRRELARLGVDITPERGSVMLRAGAIGPYGALEETLRAMTRLPSDFVFVLMGRPTAAYASHLQQFARELGLERRMVLLDRPDDSVWKRALVGADVGHMIHLRPAHLAHRVAYDLNSSLSNNRLYQYMAAALPIVSYDDPRLAGMHDDARCFVVMRAERLQQDLHDGWLALASSEDLRRQLGGAARNAHLQRYNWEAQFAPVQAAVRRRLGRLRCDGGPIAR